ncbi:MAG: hypothetical protein L0H27_09380 [Tetragenococcus halophilus]|nr:hypothetical protein [Tetragenococcus halophilus]
MREVSEETIALSFIVILLWIISLLCAVYRYIIRPNSYKGETVAEVLEIDSINYGNAKVVIQYNVNGQIHRKVIASGVKQVVGFGRGNSKTTSFYDRGHQLTIRYKENNPQKIYIKNKKPE